jgi:pentatricopeptide repeat protein
VFAFIPEKFEPTVMSYNAVIDGFCKAGRMQEGFEYLEKMGERNLSPNVASYAILISGYIELGELQEAKSFLLDACQMLWCITRC